MQPTAARAVRHVGADDGHQRQQAPDTHEADGYVVQDGTHAAGSGMGSGMPPRTAWAAAMDCM